MSTSLPPIGARIRTTTKHDGGAVVVIEGVVTKHSVFPVDTDPWVIVGDGEGVTAYVQDWPGAKVTVEVLELPSPSEPADGTPVRAGRKVFLRQVTATHGREMSWWRTGDDGPYTWSEVCRHGDVVVLVPDPAADAPMLPWATDNHGDSGIVVDRDYGDGTALRINGRSLSANAQAELLAILARQLKPGAERDALFAGAELREVAR